MWNDVIKEGPFGRDYERKEERWSCAAYVVLFPMQIR